MNNLTVWKISNDYWIFKVCVEPLPCSHLVSTDLGKTWSIKNAFDIYSHLRGMKVTQLHNTFGLRLLCAINKHKTAIDHFSSIQKYMDL